jgi:hypothetical protein
MVPINLRTSSSMRKRTKIIIGCLTVALALAAAINTAAARRIEMTEQRFLVLFEELTFRGGENTVICEVNLEGSFHSRTLSKVSGQLIGYVTQAIVHRPCIQGAGWTLNGIERTTNTLPWHILYLRFLGTLPTITGIEIQLNNGGFLIEPGFLVQCLYEATRANGLRGLISVVNGQAKTLSPIPTAIIRPRTFGCPDGTLEGEGRIGTQSTWSLIFVRLVQ